MTLPDPGLFVKREQLFGLQLPGVKVCQRLTPGATRNPECTRHVPRNPDPEQLCGFPDPARSRPDCRQPGVKDLT